MATRVVREVRYLPAESALQPEAGKHHWEAEVRLPTSLFPIRDYRRFEDSLNRVTAEPLPAVLGAIARARGLHP